MIVCEDELNKLQKLEHSSGRRQIINPSVSTDVSSIFKGKTVILITIYNHLITGITVNAVTSS